MCMYMHLCTTHSKCIVLLHNHCSNCSFPPPTPPDPTLTPHNVLQATAGTPLWKSVYSSSYLDMPPSLHDEIVAKFDAEKAKSEIVSTWLSGHPCPAWEHVLELLRRLERDGRGRKGAAKEVEEKYLKSELYIIMHTTYVHMYRPNVMCKLMGTTCTVCLKDMLCNGRFVLSGSSTLVHTYTSVCS